MPKYRVRYSIQGCIEVDAANESDAEGITKGMLLSESVTPTDDVLIHGLEGYDPNSTNGYTIDGDAIRVLEIEDLEEVE